MCASRPGDRHACIGRCKPLRRAFARPSKRLRHLRLRYQSVPTSSIGDTCAKQTSEMLAGISEAIGGPEPVGQARPPWSTAGEQYLARSGRLSAATTPGGKRFAVYPFGIVGVSRPPGQGKVERSARKPGRPEAAHAQSENKSRARKKALVGDRRTFLLRGRSPCTQGVAKVVFTKTAPFSSAELEMIY
jgi:hypothetical protein